MLNQALLLVSALLFPAIGLASTYCESQLVDKVINDSFSPPDLGAFLKAVTLIEPTKLELDFTFTSSYEARLLTLPAEDVSVFGASTLYLAHSPQTKIYKLKTKAHVESWHASAIYFEGYHFVMGFKTAEARDAAFSKIPIDVFSYKVAEDTKPFKAEVPAGEGKEFAIVFPSPVIYEQVFYLSRPGGAAPREAEKPYAKTSKQWLLKEADSYERTDNVTTYYFKGRKPVGFAKGGKHYRFLETAEQYVNFASHEEILKRQRPGEKISKDPLEQFAFGRRLLDERLSEIDSQTKLSKAEMKALNEESLGDDARLAVELNKPPKKHQTSLAGSLSYAGKRRLDRFRKKFGALPEDAKQKFAVLGEVSYEVSRLKKAEPNSEKLVRFIAVSEPNGLYWEMVYHDIGAGVKNETVLHDQLLRMTYGPHLVEQYLTNRSGKNPLRSLVTGGLIHIKYNERGQVESAKVAAPEMRLPVHNEIESEPLRMSESQVKTLEESLRKALRP